METWQGSRTMSRVVRYANSFGARSHLHLLIGMSTKAPGPEREAGVFAPDVKRNRVRPKRYPQQALHWRRPLPALCPGRFPHSGHADDLRTRCTQRHVI